MNIRVDFNDYSNATAIKRDTMQQLGDHGRAAYRVVVDSILLPVPFVRRVDAERAGRAVADALVSGNVPNQWPSLRRLMIEALAW